MDIHNFSRKDIGALGEKLAAEYLRRQGFTIIARNIAWKTGELDVIAKIHETLHIVEVKTVVCENFPKDRNDDDEYGPESNLHAYKIHKVARTAEWYVLRYGWEGEWQIDGVLVWLRAHDGLARVRYLPEIF